MADCSADRQEAAMASRITVSHRHLIAWPAFAALAALSASSAEFDQKSLDAHPVEQERDRICSKVYQWTGRFYCSCEFTVLARRVREFSNYAGIESKEDVARNTRAHLRTAQAAIRGPRLAHRSDGPMGTRKSQA